MSIDAFLFGFAALALAAIVIYALTSDTALDRSRRRRENTDDRN